MSKYDSFVSKDLSTPRLTLVMPVFNEEKTVEKAIFEVLKHNFINQLIVVNDGSTDNTSKVLSTIADPKVKVLDLKINQGKGAAIRFGFEEAIGPYVGIQDADLEYNPADLERLLEPLDQGLADAVYGSRFLSGDAHRVLYFWHSLGNKFLTLLSNMNTNLNLTDMETCYKVIRKELLNELDLQENRFGIEPEITAKLAAVSARIYEVGVSYNGRTYQEGKKIGWKDGFRAIFVIIKHGKSSRKSRKRYKKISSFKGDFSQLMGLENLSNLRNYNSWIYDKFSRSITGDVLDIGSGSGNLAKLFLPDCTSLTLLEPSNVAFNKLKEQDFLVRGNVNLVNKNLNELLTDSDTKFNTITMTNVLEHVQNHKSLLRELRKVLAPEGRVIIFVPAFEFLYSKFDLKIGHYRRYRKQSLTRLLSNAGYSIKEISYFNFFGFFAWLIMARGLRINPTKSKIVKIVDILLIPTFKRLEKIITPPFGQSLFVVAVPINKAQ